MVSYKLLCLIFFPSRICKARLHYEFHKKNAYIRHNEQVLSRL